MLVSRDAVVRVRPKKKYWFPKKSRFLHKINIESVFLGKIFQLISIVFSESNHNIFDSF